MVMKKLILLITIMMLNACDNKFFDFTSSSASKQKQTIAGGEPFFLQIGKEAYIGSEDLTLRFESVPMDCRCPEGAMCIWAGYAEVRIVASKPGFDSKILPLRMPELDSAAFYTYTLKLINLTPYPSIEGDLDTAAYRAELVLNKFE